MRGDYPQWLDGELKPCLARSGVDEARALAALRAVGHARQYLKAKPEDVLADLAHLAPEPGQWSPLALRIQLDAQGKQPPLTSEPAFAKGEIEVQDEGSQIAAILAAPIPGSQVLDLCAGAGGKTLELAALMDNKGQLYAHDSDVRRLKPIHERLQRAGVRNVQIRAPRGPWMCLADLEDHMDLVLVDAPCTGTGTWRRNPDAKWRVRPGALAERTSEQGRHSGARRPLCPPRRPADLCDLLLAGRRERAQIRGLLAKRPNSR